ncbi:MAG TPA: hypothetical protein VKW09_05700 [bacterium]|nr:hypothetical protein [bacterium]
MLIMIAVLAIPSTGLAAGLLWNGVPLPENLRIVRPQPDITRNVAAFSGKWEGWWGNTNELPSILVVEEIHDSGALRVVAVYAWGVSRAWGISKAGWVRVPGTLANGAVHLKGRLSGARVTYRMNGGSLNGLYDDNGKFTRGVFRRAPITR